MLLRLTLGPVKDNHYVNLEIAFAAAESKFHVPRLLFGSDFFVERDGDDVQSSTWVQNDLNRPSIGSRLHASSEIRRASVANNQSNVNSSTSPPISPTIKPTPRKSEFGTASLKGTKERIIVDELIVIPYLFLLLAKAPNLEKEVRAQIIASCSF
jgi:hypothetical protein